MDKQKKILCRTPIEKNTPLIQWLTLRQLKSISTQPNIVN